MNNNQLPTTDSIEELANFWDTHDLTEFEDQLEEVKESVFERETLISIDLQPQEIKKVKKIAQAQGIDYHELIKQWIVEKVSQKNMSKWRVILEKDPETGDFSVWCPELPGCTSCGETEEQALENIKEAIELYLQPDDINLSSDVMIREVIIT